MKLYVIQDGAEFYCSDKSHDCGFDPETGETSEGRGEGVIVRFPQRVRDFDVPAAQRAREWFLKQCRAQGLTPECGVQIVFD